MQSVVEEWTPREAVLFWLGLLSSGLGLLCWILWQDGSTSILIPLGAVWLGLGISGLTASNFLADAMPNCQACKDHVERPHKATRYLNRLHWCPDAIKTLEAKVKAKTGASKLNIKMALLRVGGAGNSK